MKDIKPATKLKVSSLFYKTNEWTKNDLADKTGLSLGSVTNILASLQENGIINYIGDAKSTGGRKSKLYRLNTEHEHIGIVILKRENEKHIMYASSTTLDGTVVISYEYSSPEGSLEEILDLVNKLCKKDPSISTLAISIPGISHDGLVEVCDYKKLENIRLKDEIIQSTNKKCVVENDVNAASIGLSKKYPTINHLAFLYQPTVEFVGVGIIIDHKLYNGFTHRAGELRFLPIINEKKQLDMLKNDPEGLLKIQLEVLNTVLNPELIGLSSDVLESIDCEKITKDLKAESKPRVVEIDFDKSLNLGLFAIGIENIKRGE